MHLHHRIDTTFLAELDETRLRHATVNHNDTYNYNPSGQGKKPGEGEDKIGEAIAETAHAVNPEDGSLKSKEGDQEYKNGWDIQRALEGDGKVVNSGSIDAFTEGLDIADAGKRAEINDQLKQQYGLATGEDNLAVATHNGIEAPNEADGERKGAEVLKTNAGDSRVSFDVQDGDNITDLVRRMNGGKEPTQEMIDEVIKVNELDNPDQINVGQTLVVPGTLLGENHVDTDNLATQARGLDDFMAETGAPVGVWDPNTSLENHIAHAKDPEFVKQALGEMQDGRQQERYRAFVEASYGGASNVPDELKNSDAWKNQKPKIEPEEWKQDDRAEPAAGGSPATNERITAALDNLEGAVGRFDAPIYGRIRDGHNGTKPGIERTGRPTAEQIDETIKRHAEESNRATPTAEDIKWYVDKVGIDDGNGTDQVTKDQLRRDLSLAYGLEMPSDDGRNWSDDGVERALQDFENGRGQAQFRMNGKLTDMSDVGQVATTIKDEIGKMDGGLTAENIEKYVNGDKVTEGRSTRNRERFESVNEGATGDSTQALREALITALKQELL